MWRKLFPLLFAASVVGCGGGTVNTVPVSTPAPTASPGSSATLAIGPSPATATLGSGGYALALTLPKEATGSTSTMTATISTTLPTGVIGPSALRRRTPSSLGVATTALVYVTLTSTAQVGFASAPSFTFTLPSGTSIPAGDPAYVIFYDPSSYAGGWSAILGPATASGSTITFTGITTGIDFKANTPYIYALAYTAQPVATAPPAPPPTPAPSATPTATPSAGATPLAVAPAYCSTYNFPSSGVQLNVTDDSGLGAVLILYIENGSKFMDQNGNFTQTTAYPIPAACFSSTGGPVAAKPLYVPSGVKGQRVYFAYAPSSVSPPPTPPNPFGTASISGPPVTYAQSPYPWDFVEFGTTDGATDDTSQTGAVGLPLELSVTEKLPAALHRLQPGRSAAALPAACPFSDSAVVGVTSCNFANIFQAMSANPQYASLVITQNFNNSSQPVEMRVISPAQSHSNSSFQWNLFALNQYVPSPIPTACGTTLNNGYLGCVLTAYNTTLSNARLFRTNGIGAISPSGDNYCVQSDGTANFIFTDVGAATTCVGATPNPSPLNSPNPFKMPIQELEYGIAPIPAGQGCTDAILFATPWGDGANAQLGPGSTNIFATDDAFALWKDVTADLNRGSMLTTGQPHPVGLNNPSMSVFFQDPMYNVYAQVVHTYFNNNLAYALPYDDLGAWESGVIWHTGNAINVRINAVPTASTVSAAPVPVPEPATCPTLLPSLGTF